MNKPLKIGIVTTHPIQYQVPLFREITSREGVDSFVFYGRIPDVEEQGKGFGTSFTWDLPLLQGYSWSVQAGGVDRGTGNEASTFDNLGEAYRKVDVMLIHGWQSQYMRRAWWSGIWSGVPLLVRGESNDLRSRPWHVRGFHRAYLHPFDRYLYIGEGNRRFYRNAGVSSDNLYFAPYSIENERFDEDWQTLKENRAQHRARFGVGQEAACFLFCGKFIEKKRPTDIIEAFASARQRAESPIHLLMVGDGELHDEVKARTRDEDPVTFAGFLNQTEIGEAYAAADVLVLPSNYGETWGLVVNEAMIFECPAIVSDRVGCGPDLIREGETGHTVPFGNTEALAEAMVRMAERPEQISEMGQTARDLVLSEYRIERAADGIVEAARDAYDGRA